MKPLTKEQIDFAVQCVSEWISIKQYFEYPGDNGDEYPQHQGKLSDYRPTSADADHSSLLRRLLEGKKALPKPPPRRFSYPDYDLAEGKEVEILEFYEPDESSWAHKLGVSIDQSNCFEWYDRDSQLLIHKQSGDIYRLRTKELAPENQFCRMGRVVKQKFFLQKIASGV